MKPFSKLFLCASFGLATLTIGCAEMKSGTTGGTGSTVAPSSSGDVGTVNTGPTRVSAGTQGDTLEACLARIPSDSSEGQRMLATLSCERDEKNRKPIEVVPGK
jgi:hypothetical protein